jgi:hypothetical protein
VKIRVESVRNTWSKSIVFRIFLITAIVWLVIRLGFQIAYQSHFGGEWFLADDMQTYKLASERLVDHENMYRSEEMLKVAAFQYAPSFALAFFPISQLPLPVLSIGWMLVQMTAYLLLWLRWNSLLTDLDLKPVKEILIRTLPVWLIFSPFWADLAYANVYVIMAILATLLVEAIIKHRLGWSILWLGLILQIKPQWAFAVFIPLCQRDWKFLFKLLAGAGLFYLGCMGATILVIGPDFILSQYLAYSRFMFSLNSYFPWTKLPFLGYNHSILQVVIHFTKLPFSTLTAGITALIKAILLIPLVLVSWQFKKKYPAKSHALLLAMGWYLAFFIMLDVVWEVTLAMPVLALVWPTLHNLWERWILGILIGIYAVLNIWQMLSYGIWGDSILWQGYSYLLSDPAIYIPIILLVLLALYAALTRDLISQFSSSRNVSLQATFLNNEETPTGYTLTH